ncbi:MAG: hypothetical protein LKI94_05820 [Sporolactobacillus sp.]|jgi:RNA polymerase-binding transcription factor DksA|nr:hypothetical protein [Sporolactobacillus sp.]
MFGYRKLKKRLLRRKRELKQKLKSDAETAKELGSTTDLASGELSAYDNHPADSATQLYEREKDLAFQRMMAGELREIDHALMKMEQGLYGLDERTGKKIPRARLNAMPIARTAAGPSPDAPPRHEPVRGVDEERATHFQENTFDERNAFDLVSLDNDQQMIFENDTFGETGEELGCVEALEGFAATDIDGFRGDDRVQVFHNRTFDRWRRQSDEESE